MAYRFVHAADIHLDSPLRSLALRNPELAALIGNATRQAFVRIVDLCIAEELRGQLPTECRATVLGNDAESFEAALARYVADGAEDVLARLHAPTAGEPA